MGAAALIGVQFGYVWWWFLAAVGLGTLAVAFPLALHLLAIGGALYLAWLGISGLSFVMVWLVALLIEEFRERT